MGTADSIRGIACRVMGTVDWIVWSVERAMARDQRVEIAVHVALLILFIVAFGIVGRWDYEDEMGQLAYWESRGVTIARW